MSQLLHNPQLSLVSIQSFDSVNNMFHVVSVMFWLQQTIRITFDFLQWLWPWLVFSCLYYWIGVIFSFQHDLAEWHSCVASPEDDPAGLCALARHQAGDNWMESRVSNTKIQSLEVRGWHYKQDILELDCSYWEIWEGVYQKLCNENWHDWTRLIPMDHHGSGGYPQFCLLLCWFTS